MHNKVKKSRALTIYGYPQTTSNSVRVLSPPLDRPALRAPITLTAYAQGEHHFISSTQNHHRNHQIPAPDPFVPKLSVHSPTGPGSRRSCQTCRWLSPWPTSSSSLSPPSLSWTLPNRPWLLQVLSDMQVTIKPVFSIFFIISIPTKHHLMIIKTRDKLNPHHHHPRNKLTERKRYLSKSREAIFEKVRNVIILFW